MGKRNLIGFCVLSFIVFFPFQTASGAYGGGIGSSEDPYLISEPADLLAIGTRKSDWNSYFKLTADIDMAGYNWTDENIIGESGAWRFMGSFDGNNHVISNLNIAVTSGSNIGMFGDVYYGSILNLSLDDVSLNVSSGSVIGGLVGSITYGSISNCHVTYTITAGDSIQVVGGLAGSTQSASVTNCSSRGTLTAGEGCVYAGGLVGACYSSLTDCYSGGSIKTGNSSQSIGGLVGSQSNFGDGIVNCYSTVSVNTGASVTIGGLVGLLREGYIRGSYSTGKVSGASQVGGLLGGVIIDTRVRAVVDCFSTSDVFFSNQQGGGLIGYTYRTTVSNCYSSGSLTIADNGKQGGGLVGYLTILSEVSDCYSTSTVNAGMNTTSIGGLIGLSGNNAIRRCYSAGSVNTEGGFGNYIIGGLIGGHDTGPVEDSYSVSDVNTGAGSNYAGGLIGDVKNASITNCFSAGLVNNSGSRCGGLIGSLYLTSVKTCFWDIEASGKTTTAESKGKGLTTSQMQTESTFTSAGWDFSGVWQMIDYPGMQWQCLVEASGDFYVSTAGEAAYVEFQVYRVSDGQEMSWTLSGYETCPWITAVTATTGSSTGPADITTVRVDVDPAGMDNGIYSQKLVLSDGTNEVAVPLLMKVYDPVDFDNFVVLAQYWAFENCDFGQPCKAADWYVDGKIGIEDLLQLSKSWLGEEIITFAPVIEEGFESGDFSSLNWVSGGDLPWQIVSAGAYEGSYAVKSGAIIHNQTSEMELTLDLTGWEVNTVSFEYYVSSEYSYDYLRFYIDGVEKRVGWSGIKPGYLHFNEPITAGLHTFKWVYSKDSSNSEGADSAWVDNIRFYKR